MSEKKEKWEIGYSRENYTPIPQGSPFETSEVPKFTGQLLDGRFFIEKDLSECGADAGGIGLIYLARDTKLLGREVVVKILQEDASQNEDVARKFLHEKEALIRLDHPNIVRILDSGQLSDGKPFMVMEYIPGQSLRREMSAAGQLAFDVAANIIESVSSGLAAAHAQGIIHRDIKPENIMITRQSGGDRVRLIDFGIARVERSLLAPVTMVTRGIGTVRYVAPEQLSGTPETKRSADIYSLGIVIYEMLTGERPFKPETEVEMYLLQQRGVQVKPSQLRPDISPEAEALLLRSLAFEPEDRPQDVSEFGSMIASLLRNTAGDARPVRAERVPAPTVLAGNGDVKFIPQPDQGSVLTPFKDVAVKKAPQQVTSLVRRPLLLATLALFAVSAVAAAAGIAVWKARSSQATDQLALDALKAEALNTTAPPAKPPVTREIRYFLNVQKFEDNKPVGDPFVSTGQDTFETGWRFKLVFESKDDGYLYLFNEGPDADGNIGYNLLFPTVGSNNGIPSVGADQPIETTRGKFDGKPGTEIIWMIWSRSNLPDIDAVKDAAVAGNGAVKDVKQIKTLGNFLEKNKGDKNETTTDPASQKIVVKANSDIVTHRLELSHR